MSFMKLSALQIITFVSFKRINVYLIYTVKTMQCFLYVFYLITLYKLCTNSNLCSFFITVYLTVHFVVLQTLVYNLIRFQLFPN